MKQTIDTAMIISVDKYHLKIFLLRQQGFKDGRSYRWAMFKPSSNHLLTVKKMIEKDEVGKE